MPQTFTIGGSGQTFFVGEGVTVLKTRTVGSDYTNSHRGDFTALNAFFESVGEDLSIYKGTDAGYTPYKAVATDAAGKKATGYIAAVGAGETLGSELITGWENSGSNPFETFTSSGLDITSAINTSGWGVVDVSPYIPSTGALLKYTGDITINSGVLLNLQVDQYPDTNPKTILQSPVTTGIKTYYATSLATQNGLQFVASEAVDFKALNNSLKYITDPPSTAVHIVSSLNGTTRNWASIESGFDPNAIATYQIYLAGMGRTITIS